MTRRLPRALAALVLVLASIVHAAPQRSPADAREAVLRAGGLRDARVLRLELASGGVPRELDLEGERLALDLSPVELLAPGARLVVSHPDGTFESRPLTGLRAFRGALPARPGSTVALVACALGVFAEVRPGPGQDAFCLEPLVTHLGGTRADEHVLYRATSAPAGFEPCAFDSRSAPRAGTSDATRPGAQGDAVQRALSQPEPVRANLVGDMDALFVERAGSLEAAVARVASVVNVVNLQYEREVGITHLVSALVARAPASDPYAAFASVIDTPTLISLRNAAEAAWVGFLPEVPREFVFLFSGRDSQGAIGYASFGSCDGPGVAVGVSGWGALIDGAFYSWLVAHELGHCWNAFHCACPWATMNPADNGSDTFLQDDDPSVDSVAQITAHRDALTCLDTSGVPFAAVPFEDEFFGTMLDTGLWYAPFRAEVSTACIDADDRHAAALRGGGELGSRQLVLQARTQATLSYSIEPHGLADAPEAGEDLVVEYLDLAGTWRPLAQHAPEAHPADAFTLYSLPLPPEALHGGARVRFRDLGDDPAGDHWFLDAVALSLPGVGPGKAVLVAPASGSAHVDLRPTFRWLQPVGASSYTLLVDDDPGFGSPAVQVTTPATSFTPTAALLAGTTYHWRVATSSGAGPSALSASADFATITGPPSAFAALAPADQAPVPSFELAFAWTPSTGLAGSYELQVSAAPGFASLLASASTAAEGTTLSIAALPLGVPLYWRVVARNALGTTVTPTRTFTRIVPPPPPAPTLVDPLEYTLLFDTRITFRWQPVAEASSYVLRLFEPSEVGYLPAAVPFFEHALNGTAYLMTSSPFPPAAAGLYFWSVVGVNEGGEGPAATSAFTLVAPRTAPVLPPGQFDLYSPPDGLEFTSLNFPAIEFRWTPRDGATRYVLEIDRSPSFAAPPFQRVVPRGLLASILSGEIYFAMPFSGDEDLWWRVRAEDASGATIGISQHAFRYRQSVFLYSAPPSPPGPFLLRSPAEGALVSRLPLAFAWQASPNAVTYSLYVDDSADFSSPEVQIDGLTSPGATIGKKGLASDRTYHWFVIAHGAGPNVYSSLRTFRTGSL